MRKTKKMIRLKIKEIALAKGMSMGALSRKSDVSYNTIKRIYDDEHYSITTSTLEKIARALNVSTTDLIEDIPDQQ